MIKLRPSGSELGLRSIDELIEIGSASGWSFKEKVEMPKGNFVLVWKKHD